MTLLVLQWRNLCSLKVEGLCPNFISISRLIVRLGLIHRRGVLAPIRYPSCFRSVILVLLEKRWPVKEVRSISDAYLTSLMRSHRYLWPPCITFLPPDPPTHVLGRGGATGTKFRMSLGLPTGGTSF